MLKDLLHIFRPGNPLKEMADEFSEMLNITCEMTVEAAKGLFGEGLTPDERSGLYRKDVQVNKLERSVRKGVVTHLSVGKHGPSVPYCLLLMSLVKDVERLGDYAKNLSELSDLYDGELPSDELVAELQEIRRGVEESFGAVARVFASSDRDAALGLIRQGKDSARRCEALLLRVAKSDYRQDLTTAMALAVRYYKRIGGHLLNVLSSVVMPLHKVDYYDEDEIPERFGT